MEQAIQLWGYLILAFLGVVAPILVILLSIFREGISKLTTQYENEKAQSEKDIKEQLKELAETKTTDIAEIKQSLKELKAIERTAKAKLSYLDPKKQTLRLFIPLLISFLAVILALLTKTNIYYVRLFIGLNSVCFAYAIVVLWKLLGIIIEVRKVIDADKKDMDVKTIELLSRLAEKGAQYFLKDVYIMIDDKDIKDNAGEITISANKKQELKIGIRNSENRMAKSVEIGFIFPPGFMIEKTDYYSIYTNEAGQIVRYKVTSIQGNTNFHFSGPLIITPLKTRDYKIRTFIKAENIETTYRDLNFKITPTSLAEILSALTEARTERLPPEQKGG